jgi:hypothetical protein
MRTCLLAAAAAGALLVATAASAQPREYSVEEIAADLAYGFCPLFLADTFPLDSPQLAERGFAAAVEKQPHPRFGELQMVTATREDGRVAFGGAAGKVCAVAIQGSRIEPALDKLVETMSWTGLDFKPSDPAEPSIPGVTVQSFAAAADKQTLNLQLIQSGGPTPTLVAQLFVTE